jgi:hypothetical protein
MKLLYCSSCGDIQKLMVGVPRICMCQETSGYYADDGVTAHVFGPSAEVIGFSNESFQEAKQFHQAHPEGDVFAMRQIDGAAKGWVFAAFFIPRIGEEHHVRRNIRPI